MKKRNLIYLLVVILTSAFIYLMGNKKENVSEKNNPLIKKIELSDGEWKKKLSDDEYFILREEGTERAFTSPLNTEKRHGKFVCAGCDLELFTSDKKFDSGTGWPSFWKAIEGHIEEKTDYKIGFPRTEYHCARCGGHMGHIFKDGPAPTGLRYCNNGIALKFIPEKIEEPKQ